MAEAAITLFRTARPAEPQAGMTWIPGGAFQMGSDLHYLEERPAREVAVDGFWIDPAPVTNRQFARFVRQTGWITVAETPPQAEHYPGAAPEMLVPGSLVFTPPEGPMRLDDPKAWWRWRPGATWRTPLGPDSSLAGLLDHPVVHVAWRDVQAYAAWAGKALPTEAEWEFAARGGLHGAEFAWGDAFLVDGKIMANIWQGRFPDLSTKPGGAFRTSRVGRFPANRYGLHDMIGNVWEWTSDWWATPQTPAASCCIPHNPTGGEADDSCDPRAPDVRIPRKVVKGGSHLCSPSYCRRYRPAARQAQPVDTSASHVGFRCVVRPGAPQA